MFPGSDDHDVKVQVWPQFGEQGVIEELPLILHSSLCDNALIDDERIPIFCEVEDAITWRPAQMDG